MNNSIKVNDGFLVKRMGVYLNHVKNMCFTENKEDALWFASHEIAEAELKLTDHRLFLIVEECDIIQYKYA